MKIMNLDDLITDDLGMKRAQAQQPPLSTSGSNINKLYGNWVIDPSKENMGALVRQLTPLIRSEAGKYGGGSVMESRAKTLAIEAIRRYSPNNGTRLTSWVVTGLQPLSRYRNDTQVVRMPEVSAARAAELNRLADDYSNEYGKEPTDEELADYSGININSVARLRDRKKALVSESLFAGDSDETSGGMPAVDVPTTSASEAAAEVYKTLDDKDKLIYNSITGFNNTKERSKQEIAKDLGVSPAYISQRSGAIAQKIVDVESLFR